MQSPKHLKPGWAEFFAEFFKEIKQWFDAYTKRQLDEMDAYQSRRNSIR